jgi:hypothetical protein
MSVAMVSTGWLWAGTAAAQAAKATPDTPVIYGVAGNGMPGFSGDGASAKQAKLDRPTGVAVGGAGDLYISDTSNNRVRKVTVTNVITTVAGNGTPGFGGDGGPAANAQLKAPSGVVVDRSGNVFIADTLNGRIREVNSGGTISTIAGTGPCAGDDDGNGQGHTDTKAAAKRSSLGDGGAATAASLCRPTGLAADNNGNLYVTDSGNNRVRKIDRSGVISTIAGTGARGSSGDSGPGTAAKLAEPTGIALDALNDIFIADTGNNKVRVINVGGTVTTFAGTGAAAFGGDRGPATAAKLAGPSGLGIDQGGNVYISDTVNNRIRIVNQPGTISTYAGTGQDGYSGDGGPATDARLDKPTGAVVADSTHLYFSDTSNNRVRGITSGPPPVIPESNSILLLPISAVFVAGAGFLLLRRRRRISAL